MKLADLKTIKERLAKKNYGSYEPPKNYRKTSVRAPRRLKHNGGDGGDYAQSYMSDYAISY